MMVSRSVILGVVLAIGDAAFATAQELRESPGPLEQQAKPVTPANPVPQWKPSKGPKYSSALTRMGGRAIVTLQVTLDTAGRVAEIRTVDEPLVEERGRPADADMRRKAGKESVDAGLAMIRSWTFARPVDGPLTFPVGIVFVGGTVIARLAPPAPLGGSGPLVPARVGGTVNRPVEIKRVKPVYPQKAQAERVSGVVVLEALIGVDGRVRNVRILRSVPLLDGAAEAATWQHEFEPPTREGVPFEFIMTVTQTFTLN